MTEDEKMEEISKLMGEAFKPKKIVEVCFDKNNIESLTLENLFLILNSEHHTIRIYMDADKLKKHLISVGLNSSSRLSFEHEDKHVTFYQTIEYIQVLEYGQHKNFESLYIDGFLTKRTFQKSIMPNFYMNQAKYKYTENGALDIITYSYSDNRDTKGSNLSIFSIIEKPYDVFDKKDNSTFVLSFFEVIYYNAVNGQVYELSKLLKHFEGKELLHILSDKCHYYDINNLFTKQEIEILNMMHI